MKITHDKESNAVYIKLNDHTIAKTQQVSTEVLVDFDADGVAVGIELLYVSEWVTDLSEAHLEDITRPRPELKKT
jgi:uncharacterized protein YuzE